MVQDASISAEKDVTHGGVTLVLLLLPIGSRQSACNCFANSGSAADKTVSSTEGAIASAGVAKGGCGGRALVVAGDACGALGGAVGALSTGRSGSAAAGGSTGRDRWAHLLAAAGRASGGICRSGVKP